MSHLNTQTMPIHTQEQYHVLNNNVIYVPLLGAVCSLS